MFSLSQYQWPDTAFLLAENDKFTRNLLKTLFKFTGSDICEVLSFDDLIKELDNNSSIKVVIINDYFDGHDITNLVTECLLKSSRIHFVVCTSISNVDTHKLHEYMQVDVLGKPFSPRKLMHLLDARLRTYKVKL